MWIFQLNKAQTTMSLILKLRTPRLREQCAQGHWAAWLASGSRLACCLPWEWDLSNSVAIKLFGLEDISKEPHVGINLLSTLFQLSFESSHKSSKQPSKVGWRGCLSSEVEEQKSWEISDKNPDLLTLNSKVFPSKVNRALLPLLWKAHSATMKTEDDYEVLSATACRIINAQKF